MKPFLTLALLVNIAAPSVFASDEITVVSLAEKGNAIEEQVPAAAYQRDLATILGKFEQSASTALSSQDSIHEVGTWNLRTVVVGIAARGEIALGAGKISATPKVRLGFTRGKNPPIP